MPRFRVTYKAEYSTEVEAHTVADAALKARIMFSQTPGYKTILSVLPTGAPYPGMSWTEWYMRLKKVVERRNKKR